MKNIRRAFFILHSNFELLNSISVADLSSAF